MLTLFYDPVQLIWHHNYGELQNPFELFAQTIPSPNEIKVKMCSSVKGLERLCYFHVRCK